MLEPNQFKENEAWVVFQLNDQPIRTERDGSFNCIALMDAASGFIFGNLFAPVDEPEPSVFDVRRLFKSSLERSGHNPITLFIPKGRFHVTLPAEAKRHGITVVLVSEEELLVFTEEATRGFREHVRSTMA